MRDKEALRDAEEKYRCIVDHNVAGMFVLDAGKIVFHNRRLAELFGYSEAELADAEIQQLLGIGGIGKTDPDLSIMANDPMKATEHTITGVRKDGASLWLRLYLAPIRCHGTSMLLANVVDISEQRRAEGTLLRSEQERQDLSAQLLVAQEEERRRLAAELHDSIGQNISAIKFGVENTLRGMRKKPLEWQEEQLRAIVDRIRGTIDEVHAVSMALRPSMLDDLGILATLDWFCREYQTIFPDMDLSRRLDLGESDIDVALKAVIFRIVQEALNNIAKHADADTVFVDLNEAEGGIRLRIADNGQGFAQEGQSALRRGFGLSSMRERAKLSGGTLSIDSRPGGGTTIEAVWPSV